MRWECTPKWKDKPVCNECCGLDLFITKSRDGEDYRFLCKHSEWMCSATDNNDAHDTVWKNLHIKDAKGSHKAHEGI